MKVKEACEIAEDCGLATIHEAIINIQIHAGCLFSYDDFKKELIELYEDAKNYDTNDPIFVAL